MGKRRFRVDIGKGERDIQETEKREQEIGKGKGKRGGLEGYRKGKWDKWDIGHGMQAKDTQGHGKGSWFRMHIGKGKGKYRKQERNMLKPKTNPREKGEFRVEIGNWKTGKRSVQSGNRELENWKKECLERIQGTGKWEKGEFRADLGNHNNTTGKEI